MANGSPSRIQSKSQSIVSQIELAIQPSSKSKIKIHEFCNILLHIRYTTSIIHQSYDQRDLHLSQNIQNG